MVVRWEGSISITPICDIGHDVTFVPLAFTVDAPPGLPDAPTALTSALDQTAGLFTSCVPDAAGSETVGSIPPPLGHKPALDSKCWAKITAHPGFYVIDLYFVSPSSLPSVELPVGPDWADLPGGKKSAEAARFGDLAIASHERRVAAGADDPATRYYIAAVYAQRGDVDHTRQHLALPLQRLPAFTRWRLPRDIDFDPVREHLPL